MEATEAMAAFAEAYLQGRLIAAPSGSGAELQILNERVDPNDTRVTAAWLKLNGRLNKQVNVLAKSLLEQDDEDTKATITAAVDTLRRLSAACADAANAAAKR
jgi:hypothetical protein